MILAILALTSAGAPQSEPVEAQRPIPHFQLRELGPNRVRTPGEIFDLPSLVYLLHSSTPDALRSMRARLGNDLDTYALFGFQAVVFVQGETELAEPALESMYEGPQVVRWVEDPGGLFPRMLEGSKPSELLVVHPARRPTIQLRSRQDLLIDALQQIENDPEHSYWREFPGWAVCSVIGEPSAELVWHPEGKAIEFALRGSSAGSVARRGAAVVVDAVGLPLCEPFVITPHQLTRVQLKPGYPTQVRWLATEELPALFANLIHLPRKYELLAEHVQDALGMRWHLWAIQAAGEVSVLVQAQNRTRDTLYWDAQDQNSESHSSGSWLRVLGEDENPSNQQDEGGIGCGVGLEGKFSIADRNALILPPGSSRYWVLQPWRPNNEEVGHPDQTVIGFGLGASHGAPSTTDIEGWDGLRSTWISFCWRKSSGWEIIINEQLVADLPEPEPVLDGGEE